MVKLGQDYEVFPKLVAEGAVAWRRFVKKGTGIKQAILCGAGEDAIGVSEYDPKMNTPAGASRTGYLDKEQIRVRRKGIAIVEAGGIISAGSRVKSDANGKAIAYTDPSITAGGVTVAEATAIRDAYKICKGRALTASTADGDLIEVDLEDKP